METLLHKKMDGQSKKRLILYMILGTVILGGNMAMAMVLPRSLSATGRIFIFFILMQGILLFLEGFLFKKGEKIAPKERKSFSWKIVLFSWLAAFTAGSVVKMILILIVSYGNIPLPVKGSFDGVGELSPLAMGMVALSAIVIGPAVEEVLFRGVLFGNLRKLKGFWFSAILSSLIFAIAHGELYVGIVAFVLGLMLSYLYDRCHNLLLNLLVHGMVNSVGTLAWIWLVYHSLENTNTPEEIPGSVMQQITGLIVPVAIAVFTWRWVLKNSPKA